MKVPSPPPPTVREDDQSLESNAQPCILVDVRDRYQNWIPFKQGGFSDVYKAWDSHVGRTVALKIQRINPRVNDNHLLFRHEIAMTARLTHPGVVPIYDWGKFPDERIWFAMKLVEGHTITDRIHQLNDRRGAEFFLLLRRLIDDFRRLCEPVAYAHEQNIIHRDLKPDNLMIGEFGEVHVMDWALAREIINHSTSKEPLPSDVHPDVLDPSTNALRTRIAGTPHYMPPEQAAGTIEAMGPPSDVYALGAVLYEMLCGRPPYARADGFVENYAIVLENVRREAPASIRSVARGEVPEAIFAICERAMHRAPEHRYAQARELMQAVRDWLDGTDREDRGRKIVADARRELLPQIDEQWARVAKLKQDARVFLDRFHSYDKAQDKAEGWKMEDDAAHLEQMVLREEIHYLQKIRSALEEAPHLEEAHVALAEHHTKSLLRAEERRDAIAATAEKALIEIHHKYLRGDEREKITTILQGHARLSLKTIPANAKIVIKPYKLVNRSLVLGEPENVPAQMPWTLPFGSYLGQLSAPGYRDVAYPIAMSRNDHWDGVRPGDKGPFPIRLPHETELDADDVYVPAGFFIAGGDPRAGESLARKRVWVDAFVMRRFPVTNAEFVVFLNRLVQAGRGEEALAYCPRLSAGTSAKSEEIAYLRDEGTGLFSLPQLERYAEFPVVQIDWYAAMAYAHDYAAQTGLRWRLPCELEWEKAARGVDGRYLPWGDQLEPTWACVAGSHADRKGVMPVESYRTDVSPYGVRGMAGNVKDWCLDSWHIDGPPTPGGVLRIPVERPEPAKDELVVIRGGAWISVPETMRLAIRYAGIPTTRHGALGFRLVRSFIGST